MNIGIVLKFCLISIVLAIDAFDTTGRSKKAKDKGKDCDNNYHFLFFIYLFFYFFNTNIPFVLFPLSSHGAVPYGNGTCFT